MKYQDVKNTVLDLIDRVVVQLIVKNVLKIGGGIWGWLASFAVSKAWNGLIEPAIRWVVRKIRRKVNEKEQEKKADKLKDAETEEDIRDAHRDILS